MSRGALVQTRLQLLSGLQLLFRFMSSRLTRRMLIHRFYPSQCRELLNVLLKLESDCVSKFGNFGGTKSILGSYLLLALVGKEK